MLHHEKFFDVFPGGVNSPLRSFSEVNSDPLIISRANGEKIVDENGHEYTDFINGLGSLIHGHSNKLINNAIMEQIEKGTIFSCCHDGELKLGKIIKDSSNFIDKVRFVCSGTEAVMGAIRTARAFTKKECIVRFTGSYHGHSDDVYYKGESGVTSWIDKGILNSGSMYTITCNYNDSEDIQGVFSDNTNIAAVIVEPVCTNDGLKIPSKDFLRTLRNLCTNNHSVLIFDEVVTGFRFCLGSVSNIFEIEPDISCFGKIIGGGLPVGAFGGKLEIMDVISNIPNYFQGGTFAANPVTCSAGIAALEQLSNFSYIELERKGQLFESTIISFENDIIGYEVIRLGSLITINPYIKLNGNMEKIDWKKLFSEIYSGLLDHSVLLPPSVDEPIFISLAHTDQEIIKCAELICSLVNEIYRRKL